MNTTNEFSFVLKPSPLGGIGVFAAHDITKGTRLRLFADTNPIRLLLRDDIPDAYKTYCASRGERMICPPDFGYMPIGWYLNHADVPNTVHDDTEKPGTYGCRLAAGDIPAGEEITIDYNILQEPDHDKEAYYTK